MGTGTNLVRLAEPASELLVQLVEGIDAEVMDIHALGIGIGPGDPRVLQAAWRVKVSPQRALTRDGSRRIPAGCP